MNDDSDQIETVVCPQCGDVLMRSFLSAHIAYVHPKQKKTKLAAHEVPQKKRHEKIVLLVRPKPPLTKKQKRTALRQAEKSKKRNNKFRVVLPSGPGSSMFGGIKYSTVRVFSGGLPGLGKRK